MKIARMGLFLLGFSAAQAGAVTNFPYPQNRTYNYGIKPATPIAGSWANDAAQILTKYNSWKAAHAVSAGAGGFRRIQRDGADGNDTVSEGISYGMLLAVYFDDQALFNDLWNYKQIHNDGLGLMHWRINSGGGVSGSNSATDADTDIAYSLYLAHYQWGSGGAYNYKALADAEVAKIKNYDLDFGRIKPGDAFNSCRYPSYFFPNEYRIFAQQTNDSGTWTPVRNNVYTTIAAARNNTTGLLAEQCTDTGTGGGCAVSSSQYQYNSCRIPWRMAMDYVYYGDSNAQGELNRLASFFGGINPNSVVDCYNLNGSACGGANNAAFEGPAACAFMVSGTYASNIQSYYSQLMSYNHANEYYNGALQLLTLLMLTGNMPNLADPGNLFTPTVTPSATNYAGSPTASPTQTPVTQGQLFEDFENGSAKIGFTYAGPTTASSAGYTVPTGTVHAGTYAAKVTVTTAASGYAGFGFDSNYAPIATGYFDFTGATQIRFWIKTDRNISFTVQFKEAVGGGGDGEGWISANIPLFANAAWQQVSVNISSLIRDPYGVLGNNVMSLASVKTVQFGFPSSQLITNFYVDDVEFILGTPWTATPTKTPFPNPWNQLYDDIEAPMSLSTTANPKRADGFADTANSASATWVKDSSTVASGSYSARLDYNSGGAASWGAGGYLISPYGSSALIVDASGAAFVGFWIKGAAGTKYQVQFLEAGSPTSITAGADGEAWQSSVLTLPDSGWNWVQLDLGDFAEDTYNTVCNPTGIAPPGPCISGPLAGNGVKNMQAIASLSIKLPGNQGSGSLYIDDVSFVTTYKSSTPTITPTFSNTAPAATATPSATRSSTPTPSNSPSPTSTRSGTPSASPTGTGTSTRTSTPYYSPTESPTESPFAGSPTNTPLPSATDTATLVSTFTATLPSSPSSTPTLAGSPSNTPLPSATFTLGNSATRTATPAGTLSNTPLPSSTATLANSPTRTATPNGTLSNTPLPTLSATPSRSATLANSATRTSTPAGTLSNTPLPSSSNTPSSTSPTATPTSSATNVPAAGLFEDFESVSLVGAWTSSDGASSISQALSTASPQEGAKDLRINVATAGGSWGALQAVGTNYGSGPYQLFNATGYNTIRFQIKTSQPIRIKVNINEAYNNLTNDPQNEGWVMSSSLDLSNPGYQLVEIPLSMFVENLSNTQCSPSCASGGNNSLDLSNIRTVSLLFEPLAGTTAAVVDLDRIEFLYKVPTPTPLPTATSQPGSGGNIIDDSSAAPNPNPMAIMVKLNQRADRMSMRIYTSARVLLGESSQGASGPGWVPMAWPTLQVTPGSGVYHYVVTAESAGQKTRVNGVGSFVIIK